jgi:hypothetical protein
LLHVFFVFEIAHRSFVGQEPIVVHLNLDRLGNSKSRQRKLADRSDPFYMTTKMRDFESAHGSGRIVQVHTIHEQAARLSVAQ